MPTEGLVAYSIPKGVQRGIEIDLSDQSYDGQDEGDRLVGGLGQLTDGIRGNDNFRSDVNGFGKGNIYDSWNYTNMHGVGQSTEYWSIVRAMAQETCHHETSFARIERSKLAQPHDFFEEAFNCTTRTHKRLKHRLYTYIGDEDIHHSSKPYENFFGIWS